jgi:hypothetical protein
VAPLATRIRHAVAYYHLSMKPKRPSWSGSKYHVTLNTGRLSFARTAEAIAQLALQHRKALVQAWAE